MQYVVCFSKTSIGVCYFLQVGFVGGGIQQVSEVTQLVELKGGTLVEWGGGGGGCRQYLLFQCNNKYGFKIHVVFTFIRYEQVKS